MFNLPARFLWPLAGYRRHITRDLTPSFIDDEIAVLGINTARSLTFKDGRISHDQMALIRERFAAVAADKTKVLVTHHPLFAMPIGEGKEASEAVGRHGEALRAVADAGVHILLAGHFHRSFTQSARRMVKNAGPALVIQAGTATSTRLRHGEKQSFNLIETHHDRTVEVTVIAWDGAVFRSGSSARYEFDGENWNAAGGDSR
jgi:hypothetical protein